MSIEETLKHLSSLPGPSGDEGPVAAWTAEAFRPYCDEVTVTPLKSVIAHKKGKGPKVMIAAHIDEVAMMVSRIEEDGCLRLQNVDGVDPRVLPGMRVKVYGKKVMTGVVGAKAPHLMSAEEQKKNYDFRDTLFVDMGMPAQKVSKYVSVGDKVCYPARFVPLKNGRFATKTADDRACVTIMLECARELLGQALHCDLFFVATSQEEIGSFGAMTAAFSLDADYAVVLDVCHAKTPDCPALRTHDLCSPVASMGPVIHPYLRQKLEETARKNNVTLQPAAVRANTSTDADDITLVRGGIPAVLLELPLRYMHTNVETFDMHTLNETVRLLTQYLRCISPEWEEELWN